MFGNCSNCLEIYDQDGSRPVGREAAVLSAASHLNKYEDLNNNSHMYYLLQDEEADLRMDFLHWSCLLPIVHSAT